MWQGIKDRLIGVKPQASRAEVMASRPVRNPLIAWERTAPSGSGKPADKNGIGEVEAVKTSAPTVMLLKVPRRKDKLGNVIARVFKLPDFRKLELDEIGSDVWEMCDGETNVDALTRAVCTKWRMNRRQGETSVTAYLRMLAERRLIVVRKGKAGSAAKSKVKRGAASPARKQKA